MPMFNRGTGLVTIQSMLNTDTWLVAIDNTEIHVSFLNAVITGTVVTTYYFFHIYL